MSSAMTSFSIHQEQWQDIWVAATAAVKSRKKQQVDFNIKRRIEELLQEFGPQSAKPLTLRVYGTMMKGFAVLNNERARVLYTDSERVILMLGQRPSADDWRDVKMPAAKRQRTDALALDLELGKVQESEMYNWTQPPVDAAALLHPDCNAALTVPDAQPPAQPSLLEEVHLLDEAFPPIDMQAVVPLDAAAEAVRMAEAAEAAAAASAQAEFPSVDEVAQVLNVDSTMEQPAPLIAELLAAVGDPNNLMRMAALLDPADSQVQKRGPRVMAQMQAGHVLGFDLHTVLTNVECNQWQVTNRDIGGRAREPAAFSEMLAKDSSEPDRLGLLQAVLDPSSEVAAIQRMLALGVSPVDQEGSMPEVQALLSSAEERYEAFLNTTSDQFLAKLPGFNNPLPVSGAADPFRPYVPDAPLSSMRGADQELAGVLGGQDQKAEEAAQECGDDDIELKYDEQTAHVAGILHRYMARSAGESRKMTLDDLIPPSTTDQAVAARTFLAVLTLATAGDFCAGQAQPYGPIHISEP